VLIEALDELFRETNGDLDLSHKQQVASIDNNYKLFVVRL